MAERYHRYCSLAAVVIGHRHAVNCPKTMLTHKTQNTDKWGERESRLSSLTAIEIIEVILIGECWLSDRVADECEERAEILGKSSLEGGQAVQRDAAAGGGGRCGSQHARRWTASVSAEISGAARQEWPCDQQQQQQKWSTNCPVDQQQ